ncbi:PiggyBac transposable element-derived protein 3 [Elysia marginata]|uniref:PiggyBac transposable element-derived protein 3 n=1 Tax=Elysia marginata TaxID=1093978 RepID=A0AAV4G3R7_9GAST|nr:PiggyBac transposable element-derived protein 3 [Elysia marginata]
MQKEVPSTTGMIDNMSLLCAHGTIIRLSPWRRTRMVCSPWQERVGGLFRKRKKVQIDQPSIVQAYNNYMGGVDRLDQNVGAYRIAIRSKKWWWPLFAFLPDATVNNAWLLYSMSPAHGHLPLDQLCFKRSVAMVYLCLLQAQQSVPKPITPTPKQRQNVAVDVRPSGVSHHLESMPKQRHRSHCGKKPTLFVRHAMFLCIRNAVQNFMFDSGFFYNQV